MFKFNTTTNSVQVFEDDILIAEFFGPRMMFYANLFVLGAKECLNKQR